MNRLFIPLTKSYVHFCVMIFSFSLSLGALLTNSYFSAYSFKKMLILFSMQRLTNTYHLLRLIL